MLFALAFFCNLAIDKKALATCRLNRNFQLRFSATSPMRDPLWAIMRRLIYISLIFILFSCNSTNNSSENKESFINNQDTVIRLMVNGIDQEFKVNKNFTKRLEKFQDFLTKFPTIPNEYHDTLKIDIDGDKIEDLVISKITKRNSDFILISTIVMNNKIISNDTLETDNELAFMDWNSDSIYFKLKPYTSFYDSYREKNVVEELENGKIRNQAICNTLIKKVIGMYLMMTQTIRVQVKMTKCS